MAFINNCKFLFQLLVKFLGNTNLLTYLLTLSTTQDEMILQEILLLIMVSNVSIRKTYPYRELNVVRQG